MDLGIVMTRADGTTYKLFWAKSNLSNDGLCDNPEDYGDYYAWGETKTKSDYSWSTYKFGTSEYGLFSKYIGPNGNTLLLPFSGSREGSELEGENVFCGYWSSSFYPDYPSGASMFNFDSNGSNGRSVTDRFYGYSIRPVTE